MSVARRMLRLVVLIIDFEFFRRLRSVVALTEGGLVFRLALVFRLIVVVHGAGGGGRGNLLWIFHMSEVVMARGCRLSENASIGSCAASLIAALSQSWRTGIGARSPGSASAVAHAACMSGAKIALSSTVTRRDAAGGSLFDKAMSCAPDSG